jgi:hypothetical protein
MKRFLFAAVLLIATVATGCNGGDSNGPRAGVGFYSLTKVNGATLPVTTVAGPPLTTEILSGQLTLTSDGNFTETRTGRVTPTGGTPSTVVGTQAGTWAEQDGVFAFTAKNAQGQATTVFSGSLTGTVMTFTISGTAFTYQRLGND